MPLALCRCVFGRFFIRPAVEHVHVSCVCLSVGVAALQGLLSLSEMLKFNYTLRELRLEGNLGDHEAVASFAGRSRWK